MKLENVEKMSPLEKRFVRMQYDPKSCLSVTSERRWGWNPHTGGVQAFHMHWDWKLAGRIITVGLDAYDGETLERGAKLFSQTHAKEILIFPDMRSSESVIEDCADICQWHLLKKFYFALAMDEVDVLPRVVAWTDIDRRNCAKEDE